MDGDGTKANEYLMRRKQYRQCKSRLFQGKFNFGVLSLTQENFVDGKLGRISNNIGSFMIGGNLVNNEGRVKANKRGNASIGKDKASLGSLSYLLRKLGEMLKC